LRGSRLQLTAVRETPGRLANRKAEPTGEVLWDSELFDELD